MKIGLQSSRYDDLSLFQELTFAKINKADFFDIFFDGFMPSDITPEEFALIKEMKKEGFTFTVHLPIAVDECSEKDLLSLADFAAVINPETVTVHFDKLTWNLLEKLISLFSAETKLCIENTIPDNNSHYNLCYLEFMKKAVEKYYVFSTFDTGHCNVNQTTLYKSSSGNIALFAEMLLKNGIKIATVHNHDNAGASDAHGYIGSGNINFNSFYKLLSEHNQTPMLVIEHWNNNIKSLENLKKILNDFN